MLKREGEIDFYVKCKTCFMGTFANIFTMFAEMMCVKSGQVQTEGKKKTADYAMKCLRSSFDEVPYIHDDKAMQTR